MTTEPQDAEFEQRCQAMGDVVTQTIPAVPEGTDGPLPDRLERVATRPRGGGHARRLLAWAPATVAVAAVAALIVVVTRPLGYELEGAVASQEDRFETAPGGGATVRFTDGTSIVVGQRSAARIKERTPRGATFQLEHGRAALAVVHRPSADWHVEAGPFEIAVTGTRFDVRWSEDRDSLEVVMRAGSTIVRGSLAGAGIPLHAGQRLVASLSRKALVVNSLVDGAVDGDTPRPAPPPAAVASPPAEPRETSPAPPRRDRAAAPARGGRRNLASSDRRTAPPPIPPPRPIEDAVPEVLLAPPEPPEPLPEPAVPPPPPAPAPAAVLAPPPPPPPAPPTPPSRLNGGGAACSDGSRPQLPFETLSEGFAATGGASSAFSNPVLDHSRSWCGGASLRFSADFNLDGTPDWQGQMPYQIGEATVILPAPIDIRHKTVVIHFYVDAPEDAEFSARIMADQYGKRTGDKYTPSLYAKKWWTISTTFSGLSGIFETPGMAADYASRIVLRIDAVGTRRIWAGSIYIDDVSWR